MPLIDKLFDHSRLEFSLINSILVIIFLSNSLMMEFTYKV